MSHKFAASGPVADIALSPSIVRAQRVCQEKGLTKYRWSCSKHPDLDPRLEGHLLAQTSRPGRERWLNPENVVGSKAWWEGPGKKQQGRKWLSQYQEFTGHLDKSWNLHPTQPVRDAWILGSSQGCISGNPSQVDPPLLGHQPKGYSTWMTGGGERWTPQKKGVPRVVGPREFNLKSQAGLLAISQGKSPKEARKGIDAMLGRLDVTQRKSAGQQPDSPKSAKSLGSSGVHSHAQSLPTLAFGSFPPSAAYVRSFMRQIDLEQPDA